MLSNLNKMYLLHMQEVCVFNLLEITEASNSEDLRAPFAFLSRSRTLALFTKAREFRQECFEEKRPLKYCDMEIEALLI